MFIDTNIFVNAVLSHNKYGVDAVKLISKIEKGLVSASINSHVIDEIVWTVQKVKGKTKAMDILEKILAIPNLKFLNVDKTVLVLIPDIITKYDLDPTDAIHVATMMHNSIDVIVTEDKHFDRVKSITRKSLK